MYRFTQTQTEFYSNHKMNKTMQLLSFIADKFDSLLLNDNRANILLLCDEYNALQEAFEAYQPESDVEKISFLECGLLAMYRTLHEKILQPGFTSDRKKYLIHLPYFTKDSLNRSILYQYVVLPNTEVWSQNILYYIEEYAESVKSVGRDELVLFMEGFNPTDVSLERLDQELEDLQLHEDSLYWNNLLASESFLQDVIDGQHTPTSDEETQSWYTFVYNQFALSESESNWIQQSAKRPIELNEALYLWLLKADLALNYSSVLSTVLDQQTLTDNTKRIIKESAQLIRTNPTLQTLVADFEDEHIEEFRTILHDQDTTEYLYTKQKELFLENWIEYLTQEPTANGVDPNTVLSQMSDHVFDEYALHIRILRLCSTWKQYLTSNANVEERTFSGLTSLIEFYSEISIVDGLQRQVSFYMNTLSKHSNQNDHLRDEILSLTKHLQNVHWEWTTELYEHTLDIYTENQEVLPFVSAYQQRQTFYKYVEPNSKHISFAYILLDAFRYEMFEDLKTGLQSIFPHLELRAHPTLSETPSITDVGMNLIGPMLNNNDKLVPVLNKPSAAQNASNIIGFKSPTLGKNITNRGSRVDSLNISVLQCDSGAHTSGHPLRGRNPILSITANKQFSDDDFLAIHFGDIDALGDKSSGELYQFDNAVGKLIESIAHLIAKGVKRFVLTSDHGYLIRHEKQALDIQTETQQYRRHFIAKTAIEHEDIFHVSFDSLGYSMNWTGSYYIHFPRTLAVFSNSDRDKRNEYTFIHGGPSIQERLVPTVTFDSPNYSSTPWQSVEVTAHRLSSNRLHVSGRFQVPTFSIREFAAIVRV